MITTAKVTPGFGENANGGVIQVGIGSAVEKRVSWHELSAEFVAEDQRTH